MASELEVPPGRDAQREAQRRAAPATAHTDSFAVLAIAVLGVVYGDIGTSPTAPYHIPAAQAMKVGLQVGI